MMKKSLLTLLLFCLAPNLLAQEGWQDASKAQLELAFSQFSRIAGQGQFTQQKFFRFLSRPVISSGHYQQIQGESPKVIWHTQQPIYNKLLLTPSEIRQQTEPEGELKLLTQDVALAQLLFAVVSGELTRYQGIHWQSNGLSCLKGKLAESQWHQFVSTIQLCSQAENPNSVVVELIDNKATRTHIQLTATL